MSDLQNLTPANTYKGLLQVGDYTNGVDSTVKAVLDGEGTASALAIGTTKVGIGTTSPTQELDVNGDIVSTTLTTSGAVTAGSLDVSGNVVADEYALDQTGTSSSAVAIHAPATNELAIRTNSTEALRIDSLGQVGIGIANPSAKLDVNGDIVSAGSIDVIGSNADLRVAQTTAASGAVDLSSTATGGVINLRDASGVAVIDIDARPGNDIVFNNGGNVGIGVTSPDTPIHVDVAGQSNVLKLTRDDGVNGILTANFVNADFNLACSDGGYKFSTSNATDAMTIDSDGNCGIGTNSPSAPLEVSSTTHGVILPRMTTSQMNAITNTTNGEMIYNTTENKFYGRANDNWVALH